MQDDVVMVLCNSNECRGNCDLSLLCDTKPTLGGGSWKPPGINPSFAFCYVTGLAPSKYGSTYLFTFVPLVKKIVTMKPFYFHVNINL